MTLGAVLVAVASITLVAAPVEPASANPASRAVFTTTPVLVQGTDETDGIKDDLYLKVSVSRLPAEKEVRLNVAVTRVVEANCILPQGGQVGPREDRMFDERALVTDSSGALTVDPPFTFVTRLFGDVCPETGGGPFLVTDYSVTYDIVITVQVVRAQATDQPEPDPSHSLIATFSIPENELVGLACTIETEERGHCN